MDDLPTKYVVTLRTLFTDDERIPFGQIGRTLLSPYTIEEIEEGVTVQIGGANLTLHTLIDADRGARGIKVKWITTPLTRLEDCFDFGRSSFLSKVAIVILSAGTSLLKSA